MIPRGVVIIIFLTEVFYLKKLHYFYLSLGLLLLPLSLKIIDKVITQFYIDNFEDTTNCLIITESYNNETEETTLNFKLRPDLILPKEIKDINDLVDNHYVPLKEVPILLCK